MKFDLVLKNGTVIDPSQSLHALCDLAIHQGAIAEIGSSIPSSQAQETVDVKGHLLTPGLIDIHTHVAEHFMPIAANVEEAGVKSGVTTVCDAGSIGYAAYDAFKHHVILNAETDVFCFLHLSPTGQMISPEICWENLDAQRVLNLLAAEAQFIKGIKIRANGQLVANPDLTILKLAKEICAQADLPLMIHIGLNFEENVSPETLLNFNRRMLPFLDAGDILTHTYTSRPGGVIFTDQGGLPELHAAMERGMVLDVAPAKSHFSFELAEIGLEAGILPTVLSTDITKTNYQGPALFSLAVVMSKFLAVGLELEDVLAKTTQVPAQILNEPQRGSLSLGNPADITVFELLEGDFLFSDGIAGNTRVGDQLLEPRMAIKAGRIIPAKSRFRNHILGEEVSLTKGA
jgi:dihydroorotase